MGYTPNSSESRKQSEMVFTISTIFFILATIGLIIGGFVFLVNAFKNQRLIGINILYAFLMWISIAFAWMVKVIIDAIAMNLANSAELLEAKQIKEVRKMKIDEPDEE